MVKSIDLEISDYLKKKKIYNDYVKEFEERANTFYDNKWKIKKAINYFKDFGKVDKKSYYQNSDEYKEWIRKRRFVEKPIKDNKLENYKKRIIEIAENLKEINNIKEINNNRKEILTFKEFI